MSGSSDPIDDPVNERNAVRFADDGFHAYAPNTVYAILAAEPVEDTMDPYDDEIEDTPRRYKLEHAINGVPNAYWCSRCSTRHTEMSENPDADVGVIA